MGLGALAPPLLRLASLKVLNLSHDRIGNTGILSLVGPPPELEGADGPELNPMLSKLKRLLLNFTQVTDAGCVTLTLAITSNRMPALRELSMRGSAATNSARDALHEALLRSVASRPYFLDARMKLKLHLVTKARCPALLHL